MCGLPPGLFSSNIEQRSTAAHGMGGEIQQVYRQLLDCALTRLAMSRLARFPRPQAVLGPAPARISLSGVRYKSAESGWCEAGTGGDEAGMC